jgi:hypothetical protein
MVKKALINGLESENLSGEDLYDLDDNSLFSLLENKYDVINNKSLNNSYSLINAVREGRIFSTVLEISHEKTDFLQIIRNVTRDTDKRSEIEEQFAGELRNLGLDIKGNDIIIDIPEPVSFETGLYIIDEECNFNDSSSAFKKETINAFIKSLYTIRLFINKKLKETIKTFPQVYAILDNIVNSYID